MRIGYGARGLIYVTVGALAFAAAMDAAEVSGTKDALAVLRSQPFGVAALWIIGLGLFAYMIWRIVAGVFDVEDHGSDAKGLFARASQIITGLIHGVIGLSVLGLAWGGRSAGGSNSAQDWTQWLMSMPFGRYVVALIAAILVGAGLYYAHKGWQGAYKSHLASSSFTEDVDPVLKGGLIVYGALLALVAASLGFAAWQADPNQAGGLGQALQQLKSMTFGRVLLGIAGLGLLSFALYNFVEAAYRVTPKINGSDVKTLARAAKAD